MIRLRRADIRDGYIACQACPPAVISLECPVVTARGGPEAAARARFGAEFPGKKSGRTQQRTHAHDHADLPAKFNRKHRTNLTQCVTLRLRSAYFTGATECGTITQANIGSRGTCWQRRRLCSLSTRRGWALCAVGTRRRDWALRPAPYPQACAMSLATSASLTQMAVMSSL